MFGANETRLIDATLKAVHTLRTSILRLSPSGTFRILLYEGMERTYRIT